MKLVKIIEVNEKSIELFQVGSGDKYRLRCNKQLSGTFKLRDLDKVIQFYLV